MSDRFPSISQDGERIAASALPRSGRAVQFVGPAIGDWQPERVDVDASGGVWQTSTDLLFVRNKDRAPDNGAILRWDGARVTQFRPPGLEGFSCHNGHFAGWTTTDRLKSITVSRDWHRAGTVDVGDGRNVILEVDEREIDYGPIAEPRYSGEALVWVRWVDGIRRIFGRRQHGAPTEDLSWPFPDDEFWPLAIETPLGLYVLTHGHPELGRPLWLRPWAVGQTHGHVVAHGFTDRPDARTLARGMVLVAFSNLVALQRVHVNLAAPLEDVRGPIIVPPVDPPTPPVDPPQEPPRMAPNRFAAVQAIAAAVRPTLTTHDGADHFTAQVAATLHFGSAALNIQPDANWGRRRNPSGILSDDVIQYRSTGENFDIIPGAGSSSARPGWSPSTPGPWVAPESGDVVGGSTPPVDPSPTQPPVTPTPTAPVDLGPVLAELQALRTEVQTTRADLAIHEQNELNRYHNLGDQQRLMNEGLAQLLQRG